MGVQRPSQGTQLLKDLGPNHKRERTEDWTRLRHITGGKSKASEETHAGVLRAVRLLGNAHENHQVPGEKRWSGAGVKGTPHVLVGASGDALGKNHVAEATKAAQARAQDPAILLHTQPKRELVSPKGPIRYPKVHGSIIPDRPKQSKCHSTAEWRDQNSAEPWKEGLLLATRSNVTDNVRESCPIAGTSPPPPPSALVLAKPPCLGGGAGGCSSHSGSNANLLPHLQLGSQHSLSP